MIYIFLFFFVVAIRLHQVTFLTPFYGGDKMGIKKSLGEHLGDFKFYNDVFVFVWC